MLNLLNLTQPEAGNHTYRLATRARKVNNFVVAASAGKAVSPGDIAAPADTVLRVKLIGPFSVTLGGLSSVRWERPPARWLCQFVLSSPSRRVTREGACVALFPQLGRAQASAALSKALSQARAALAPLASRGQALLQADRGYIWADLAGPCEVDLDLQQSRLETALNTRPGLERDDLLVLALAEGLGEVLLEDGPSDDWAERRREHFEWERQEARLALARDRAGGMGRRGSRTGGRRLG